MDVVEDGNTLRIIRANQGPSHGQRLVVRMRGRAAAAMTTDQLLRLVRGD